MNKQSPEIDLGTATAAEMGTTGHVSLGTADASEMSPRRRNKATTGVSLEIYQAKQQRLLKAREELKKGQDKLKPLSDEIAALESWLQETMGSLNKDRDYCDGHTISITKSLQASIASADADEVIPILQEIGWDGIAKVNPSSITARIKGEIATVVENGYCDIDELSKELWQRVMDECDTDHVLTDDGSNIVFSQITDDALRGEIIQHVATPLKLRPYLKTYTKTGLSIRKSK